MGAMREELILADKFSDPLRNYTSGLSRAADASRRMVQGAQSGAAAVAEGWKGAARDVQNAAAISARNQEYVVGVQADTAQALSGSKTVLAGAGNSVRQYAAAVAGAESETNRARMAFQMESQALQLTIEKYGAGSTAAMQQAQAVNQMAGTVEQAILKEQAHKAVLTEAAGGSRGAARAVEEYQKSVSRAASATSGLIDKVKGLVGTYLGLRGLKGLAGLSDSVVQTEARLNLVNDGSMSTDELKKMIFDSAQRSRGDYMGTADMVSKMGIMAGDAFKGPEELVGFSEVLNKMYTVSGTNLAGQQAATLQLEQAMAMGVLRGQEFRSVVQQVPMLVQGVADALGVSTGEVKKLADEGKITADVVKNAMFMAADDVNAKFETMPMTWGQVWISMKNTAMMAAEPLLKAVNWLANIVGKLGPVIKGLAPAFERVGAGVLVFAAALGVYTVATWIATGAAKTFFATLLANPITWVALGVAVLVGLLYAGVEAFNKFTGASVSATGIITGAFATAGAFIANVFFALVEIVGGVIEFWYNGFVDFVNFFANVFNDPVGSVIRLFGGMADKVLGVIEKIAQAMDFVFGSHFADTVAGWRSSLGDLVESAANKYGNGSYQKLVEHLDVDAVLSDLGLSMERFNYGDAYQAGYDWGANLSMDGLFGDVGAGFDIAGMASDIGDIAGNTGKTAKNTADMADEDLKYLEDVAVRRYETKVNTTNLTPSITVNVKGSADKSVVDDITSTITMVLAQQAASHTTLSYAEVGV